MVAAAILASCSTQMVIETERSQIKKGASEFWSLRMVKRMLLGRKQPEQGLKTARTQAAIRELTVWFRFRGEKDGFRYSRADHPVAALIFSAHRSQAKMNSTTTTLAGWLRHTSHTV